VSADGNFVAFQSGASNLVPGQTAGGTGNIFLLDRTAGTMTLVSHIPGSTTTPGSSGVTSGLPTYTYFGPKISADGRFVAYSTNAPEIVGKGPNSQPEVNVVLFDRLSGQNKLVSASATGPGPADEPSFLESISGDGRYIVFGSTATDLVAQQVTTTAHVRQLFVYDSTLGQTFLVSHAVGQFNLTANDESDGPATVADNGTIAYVSAATNLDNFTSNKGNVYLYSPGSQANQLITFVSGSTASAGNTGLVGAYISRDGSAVAYISEANDLVVNQSGPVSVGNIFRYDTGSHTTSLVSGSGGSPSVSANATSGGFGALAISGNGQSIVFDSLATDLVASQTGVSGNVFLYNVQAPGITLLSGVGGSSTDGAGGPDLNPTPGHDPLTYLYGQGLLSISYFGTRVAFVSQANDIVSGQTGLAGNDNLYVYSSATGQTQLVSGAGGSGTADSDAGTASPALNSDGSLLAFHTLATNLISNLFDGNGTVDVFTYTPNNAALTLVSRAAFMVRAPGDSFSTSVSADGRYTVFTSTATDLVTNQVNVNPYQNVFLFDKATGAVSLVNHAVGLSSTTGDGGLGNFNNTQPVNARPPDYLRPVISADGSFVAFVSYDTNLVPNEMTSPAFASLYLYNVQTGGITLVNHDPNNPDAITSPPAFSPAINADGRYVAYAYGTSLTEPFVQGAINLYDRVLDTTTVVLASNPFIIEGTGSHPVISDDGRFVAYENSGNVDVFDKSSGTTALVSHSSGSLGTPANASSSGAVISHDGSFIAFASQATDLVGGLSVNSSTNVFLYKNDGSGAVSLVSGVNGSATQTGNGNSDSPAIDGDGSYIAYRSDATDLANGQTGPAGSNIFEFNRAAGTQTLVSAQSGTPLTAATGNSTQPVIDEDGHLISYVSTAGNLIPGQSGTAGVKNVFLWLRPTAANILVSGQNGSPTITGNADSDGPLLTRHSIPGFSSAATNLQTGVGGTSVAWINTLVALSLTPNTVADGSTAPTTVGTLTITSLLPSQFKLPAYTLPGTEADNQSFGLGTNAGGEILIYTATMPVSYAKQATYQVSVHVDIGLGDDVAKLSVTVTRPALTVTVNVAIGQADPTTASPINFTAVFSAPVAGFTAADVTLGGTAGANEAVVTGGGTTYNVAVSGMAQVGTVVVTVPAGVVRDANGDPNTASSGANNTVTFTGTPQRSIFDGFTGPNQLIGAAEAGNGHQDVVFINGDQPNSNSLLAVNTAAGVVDYAYTHSPNSFAGWTGPSDRAFIGNIDGSGDELIMFHRVAHSGDVPTAGAIQFVNLQTGIVENVIQYGDLLPGSTTETYGDLLDGMVDPEDVVLLGHFTQQNHLEALFFNRTTYAANNTSLLVLDLANARSGLGPVVTFSSEHDGNIFGGWTDSTNEALASDMAGDGYDDLVLVKRVANPQAYETDPNVGFIGIVRIYEPGAPPGPRGFYRFFHWSYADANGNKVFPGYDDLDDHAVGGNILINGVRTPVIVLINSQHLTDLNGDPAPGQAAYAVLKQTPLTLGTLDGFVLESAPAFSPNLPADAFSQGDSWFLSDVDQSGSDSLVTFSRGVTGDLLRVFDPLQGMLLGQSASTASLTTSELLSTPPGDSRAEVHSNVQARFRLREPAAAALLPQPSRNTTATKGFTGRNPGQHLLRARDELFARLDFDEQLWE
jgi:hypothetical protein